MSDQESSNPAHTPEGEHPAGDGPRTDREVGGPVAEEDAAPTEGGITGDKPTEGLEPHS